MKRPFESDRIANAVVQDKTVLDFTPVEYMQKLLLEGGTDLSLERVELVAQAAALIAELTGCSPEQGFWEVAHILTVKGAIKR